MSSIVRRNQVGGIGIAVLVIPLLGVVALPLGAEESEELPGVILGLGTIDEDMAGALRGVTGEDFERALASLDLEPIEESAMVTGPGGVEVECSILVGKPGLKYLLFFANLEFGAMQELASGLSDSSRARLAVRYETLDGKTHEKTAKDFRLSSTGRTRRHDFRWVVPVGQWKSFELFLEIDPKGTGNPEDMRRLEVHAETSAILQRLQGG